MAGDCHVFTVISDVVISMEPQHWKPPDISSVVLVQRVAFACLAKKAVALWSAATGLDWQVFQKSPWDKYSSKTESSLEKEKSFQGSYRNWKGSPADCIQINNKMVISICPLGCLGGIVLQL